MARLFKIDFGALAGSQIRRSPSGTFCSAEAARIPGTVSAALTGLLKTGFASGLHQSRIRSRASRSEKHPSVRCHGQRPEIAA
jgi:hypothetical protein